MSKIQLSDDRARDLATRSSQSLQTFFRRRQPNEEPLLLRVSGGGDHKTVAIPQALASIFTQILEELGKGCEIAFVSLDREVSTQEAADYLQVSRPFLIDNLLETGRIPFHRVGNRRRIRFEDLREYRAAREESRKAALRELAKEAQELEMGYE